MDLHIHSICSDGTKSPIEILKIAQDLNLEYISITDHDTCDAYEMLDNIELSKYYTGKIIPGCELITCFNGILIEILAYQIDWKKMNNWLKIYYSIENIEIRERQMFNILKQTLLSIPDIQFSDKLDLPTPIPYSGYFKFMIYEDLLKYESNNVFFKKYNINNIEDFLRKGLYNPDNPIYLNQNNFLVNAKEIVDLIHHFGGLAFLAHMYKIPVNHHLNFVQQMLDNRVSLDGIEANYSSFSRQQENEINQFCKDKKLFLSGGSDYHGVSTRTEKLGYGTEGKIIPKKYVEEWYNKTRRNYETTKI